MTMDTERFQVLEGAAPAALDRIVAMHAGYYAKAYGMGDVFERKVSEGLTEFLPRLQNPRNRLWLATTPNHGGQIVGSIAIDGEDLGAGQAHLRWFILDDGFRAQGLGSALLRRAIEFVDQERFTRTVLWTVKGLDAARHLYERCGFRLAVEYAGEQWGVNLMEQRFVREGGTARSAG